MVRDVKRIGIRTLRLVGLALVAAACAPEVAKPAGVRTSAPAEPPYELLAWPEDAEVAESLAPVLDSGVAAVQEFFGRSFPEPFTVDVFPDRESFDLSFPPEWGMGSTACWMVAAGVRDSLRMISPRVWSTQACEHDAGDERHVQGIVTHELVHVFHGQNNPTGDFVGADDMGWFIEGLAVYASGQLAEGHSASAAEAVERGLAPAHLSEAWSGQYRYGVCGSLVEFMETRMGRDELTWALAATGNDELLASLGMSEAEFLEAWQAYVRGADD